MSNIVKKLARVTEIVARVAKQAPGLRPFRFPKFCEGLAAAFGGERGRLELCPAYARIRKTAGRRLRPGRGDGNVYL